MGEIACRIKAAMELRDIKAIRLAELTNMSRGTISNYLSGRYEPKSDALKKIAAALGVSVSWLVADDEAELFEIYKRLDKRGKMSLLNCARSILEAMNDESGKD